jgi:hypothetical protein
MALDAQPGRGKVDEEISLSYTPPMQKGEDGYLKFFITGGSISRREQRLVALPTTAGALAVEAYLVEPGYEVYKGKLTITIEQIVALLVKTNFKAHFSNAISRLFNFERIRKI